MTEQLKLRWKVYPSYKRLEYRVKTRGQWSEWKEVPSVQWEQPTE